MENESKIVSIDLTQRGGACHGLGALVLGSVLVSCALPPAVPTGPAARASSPQEAADASTASEGPPAARCDLGGKGIRLHRPWELAVSPDEGHVAVIAGSGEVHLFDTRHWRGRRLAVPELLSWSGSTPWEVEDLRNLTFSGDASLVFAVVRGEFSSPQDIVAWSVKDAAVVWQVEHPSPDQNLIAVSEDGRAVAIDGPIRSVDMTTGEKKAEGGSLHGDEWLADVQWASRGGNVGHLVWGTHDTGQIRVYTSDGVRYLFRQSGPGETFALSPSGLTLASATDGCGVEIWPISRLRGAYVMNPMPEPAPRTVRHGFATAEELNIVLSDRGEEVLLWSRESPVAELWIGEELRLLPHGPEGRVLGAGLLPRQNLALTLDDEGLNLWSMETGERVGGSGSEGSACAPRAPFKGDRPKACTSSGGIVRF